MGLAVYGGSVVFDDLFGSGAASPTFDVKMNSFTVERVGRVAWSDVDALYDECFPSMPSLPGLYPGTTNTYVTGLRIKPHHPDPGPEVDASGNVPSYDFAEVHISYGPLDLGGGGSNPPSAADLITRKKSITSEFITMEGVKLFWDHDGAEVTTEGVTFGKMIPIIKHSLTLHRVSAAAAATAEGVIRSLIGKVNDGEFEGASAECLLFTGAEIESKVNNQGEVQSTIQYELQERSVKHGDNTYGWNHYFRPDGDAGGGFWQKLRTAGGLFTYKSADFSDLV